MQTDRQDKGCAIMRRKFRVIIVSLIAITMLIICCISIFCSNERPEVYMNMINNAFDLSLNETNSQIYFEKSILSRDSIYVVFLHVFDGSLLNNININNQWSEDINFLEQHFLIPYSDIDGINSIIRTCKNGRCFYRLNVLDYKWHNFEMVVLANLANIYDFDKMGISCLCMPLKVKDLVKL